MNWLVDVVGDTSTIRSALEYFVDSTGKAYTARLLAEPSIRKRIGSPSGGVQLTDDISIDLSNEDGSINSLIVPGGTNDARGKAIRIYSVPRGSTTTTLRFEGIVTDTTFSGSGGVRITGQAEATELLKTQIPSVIIEPTTFVLAASKSLVPQSSQGETIPLVFGETRQHFIAQPIKEDAANSVYDFVIGHTGVQNCRLEVSSVYSLTDGRLNLINTSEYQVLRSTYSGYTVIRFALAQLAEIVVDCECTEYDTESLSGIVDKHFTFNENLNEEIDGSFPLTIDAITTGEWLFDGDSLDTSTAGKDLVEIGAATPLYVSELGGDQAWRRASGDDIFWQAPASTDFDFIATDDFNIQVRAKLTGRQNTTLVTKLDSTTNTGYELRVIGDSVRFKVADGVDSLSVISKTAVSDTSIYHEITASVDRTAQTISLTVDGFAATPVDITAIGSLSNTTTLSIGGRGSTGNFEGDLGRVAILSSLPVFVDGQSGHRLSAIDLSGGENIQDKSASWAAAAGAWSQMAWLKRNGNPSAVESIKHKTTIGWTIDLQTSGTITASYADGTVTLTATGSTVITDNKWHQVWVTYDNIAKTLALYVDGVLDVSDTNASFVQPSGVPSAAFIIGIAGQIDEYMFNAGSLISATTIRDQYLWATGNPAILIRESITNTTWGLSDTIDSTTFTATEDELKNTGSPSGRLVFGGALTKQTDARTLFDAITRTYGMVLKRRASWELNFAWKSTTQFDAGWRDDKLDNVLDLTNLGRLKIDSVPKIVRTAFGVIDRGAATQSAFSARTAIRTVASSRGVNELVVDLPLVREWETADRIANFLANWLSADGVISASLGSDFLGIETGDILSLTAPTLGLSVMGFRIVSTDVQGTNIRVDAVQNVTNPTTYVATTQQTIIDPDDGPDFRRTVPLHPSSLILVSNTADSFGAIAEIQFTMSSGDLTDAIVRNARISWRVSDANTTESSQEWKSEDVPATPGETITFKLRDLLPGVIYEVFVVSVSIFNQVSGHTPQGAGSLSPDTLSSETEIFLQFTAKLAVVSQPRSVVGLDSRLTNVEVGDVQVAGAKGDGQTIADGAMTSSSAVLTSASNPFVSADVGKLISVTGAGVAGVALSTTIASFQSAGQVTLTVAASTTVSSVDVSWATDDTAAIQATIDAVEAANGGMVIVPQGSFGITTTILLPKNKFVHMKGVNREVSVLDWYGGSGSALKLDGLSTGDNTGFVLQDLRVNNKGSGTRGIDIQYATFSATIARCMSVGFANEQFYLINFENGLIEQCRAELDATASKGFFFDNANNVKVIGCQVHTAGRTTNTDASVGLYANNIDSMDIVGFIAEGQASPGQLDTGVYLIEDADRATPNGGVRISAYLERCRRGIRLKGFDSNTPMRHVEITGKMSGDIVTGVETEGNVDDVRIGPMRIQCTGSPIVTTSNDSNIWNHPMNTFGNETWVVESQPLPAVPNAIQFIGASAPTSLYSAVSQTADISVQTIEIGGLPGKRNHPRAILVQIRATVNSHTAGTAGDNVRWYLGATGGHTNSRQFQTFWADQVGDTSTGGKGALFGQFWVPCQPTITSGVPKGSIDFQFQITGTWDIDIDVEQLATMV